MEDSIMISNQVSKPAKPLNSKNVTKRCLAMLLDGHVLNRTTLDDMRIAAKNTSLHSIVSILRNEYLIPIVSERICDDTCNYYMQPEEIIRYNDPELREQQQTEMQKLVNKKRQKSMLKGFLKFLEKLEAYPQALEQVNYGLLAIDVMKKAVDALRSTQDGR